MFESLDTSELKTWDDIVTVGQELKTERLQDYFYLGDLANHACPDRKRGRPKINDDGKKERYTISALSFAIGENRSRVSNAAADAKFWTGTVRQELPLEATETELARARKASGWKPSSGENPSQTQRQAALEELEKKVDDDYVRPKPPVINYVKGAYSKLDKALERKEEMDPVDRELVQDAKDRLAVVTENHKEKDKDE